MKVCQKCGTQNECQNNFCSNCATPLNNQDSPGISLNANAPQKSTKKIYQKAWFWVVVGIVVLGIIGAASGGNGPNSSLSTPIVTATSSQNNTSDISVSSSPSPSASLTTAEKSGIKPDDFTAAVNKFISAFNAKKTGIGDLTAKVEVMGSSAFVSIYLSDLSSWSNSNDTDKKEFINSLGNAMDKLAATNAYSTNDTVGVETNLYSPSELKLAERSIWGNVKLY